MNPSEDTGVIGPPAGEPDLFITFQCPQCGRFCAFKARYAGRFARCLNCHTRMQIPFENQAKAKKSSEIAEEPLEGFFAAALKHNPRDLVRSDSLAPLLFVAFLVTLKYFLGHVDASIPLPGFTIFCPIGWMVLIFNVLFLPWYAMQVIESAAFGIDALPDIYTGSFFSYLWELLRDAYYFLVALILSVLPFSLLAAMLEVYEPLRLLIFIPAFFLFPVTLLLLATGADFTKLFRYDLFLRLIRRFPGPYLFTAAVTALALIAVWLCIPFLWLPGETAPRTLAWQYPLTLAAAIFLLPAMRCLGLFAYHYLRALPELALTD